MPRPFSQRSERSFRRRRPAVDDEGVTLEPQQRRALGVVFLVVVVDLLGFGVLLPLLAQYGKRLHAEDWQIGLLSASFSLVQFVFSPLWGRLSDRVGRRPVLMCGLFAS